MIFQAASQTFKLALLGVGVFLVLSTAGDRCRYVLFSRYIHGNRDLILGFAFELRDGKAYALWQSPGHDRPVGELPGADVALTEEQTFIRAVRDAVSHPGSARYLSAPRK